jgi:DNA-binding NarL/FixJ family response regulator
LGQDNDVQRALKLGAVGYVNKTFFDFGNLKSKIEAAIAAKKV